MVASLWSLPLSRPRPPRLEAGRRPLHLPRSLCGLPRWLVLVGRELALNKLAEISKKGQGGVDHQQ